MIAIVASMDREVLGLRKALEAKSAASVQAGSFLVHVTGVGKERALKGIKDVLCGPSRPALILSLGFAGALREGLFTGDLVLARRLCAVGEDDALDPDLSLLDLAQEAVRHSDAPRHFTADSLTVSHVVSSVAEKGRLARDTTAWVANMEDYWLGRTAIQEGIPFLSVRAVLDTAQQELPPFLAGLENKGALRQTIELMAHGITDPRRVLRVAILSKQARLAQDRLTAFGLLFTTRAMATGIYAPV